MKMMELAFVLIFIAYCSKYISSWSLATNALRFLPYLRMIWKVLVSDLLGRGNAKYCLRKRSFLALRFDMK